MEKDKEMKILDLPLKKEWYEMIESGEKKEETIKKAVAWLEDNIVKETEVIAGGPVSIRFNGLLEKFKKAMEN